MVNELEFKKANNYSLKCMRVGFIVMVIAWILNILHIFIVDQSIMNNTLIGVAIFLALGYAVKYALGFEKAASNYIMLFLLVAMISFANMELAYHATLFMIFPMICSIAYTDKKYKTFTLVLTIGGFFLSVVGGYYWGLCDANTLVLTTTSSAKEAETLNELVTNFKSRADEIVDDANNEGEITGLTEESFARVKSIAEELLTLSHASI